MNTALELLNCSGNQLTSLDVSVNASLTFLRCNSNLLTSLELNIGSVVGQNSGYYSTKNIEREPNTFFQTNFTSFSINLRAYVYRHKNFKVFIGQGIGGIRFVPKDELEEKLSTSALTSIKATQEI